MKIAIKVLTEWDRENLIPFFEKHFPGCNDIHWKPWAVEIGEVWFLDETLDLVYQEYEDLSNYTILQGVPQNMELPKLEENRVGYWQTTKTREQELEECLELCINFIPSHYNEIIYQAKQLLNK